MAGSFQGKAIIIGGGIGGLATAIALQKVGIEAEVYERASEIREAGAGVALWSNALVSLRQLGLETAVTKLGATVNRMDTYTTTGQHLCTTDFDPVHKKAGALSLCIHRASLQRTLAQAIPNETIHTASDCVGVEEDENGVSARFADGSSVKGDLLIGADGIRSVVRRELFGPNEPRYAGYTCWRGISHLEHTELPAGHSWLVIGHGTQMGFWRCSRDQIYWFVTQNAPAGISDPPNKKKQSVLSVAQELHAMFRRAIEATEESAIMKNDILDRPPTRKWGTDKIILLGDAAHPTTPNLGMGACQAIEDSVFLADSLKQRDRLAESLRYYQDKRRHRTAFVTNRSWWLGKIFQFQNPVAVWLRNATLKWEFGNQIAFKSVEKLWSNQLPGLGSV